MPIVTIASREATLKRRLRRHLTELGFQKNRDGSLAPPTGGKEAIRALHRAQRNARLALNEKFIADRLHKSQDRFASGEDVDPAKISPVLERIYADTWQGDLFRLASLTWSVPVSNGFGRRMRYLVWDEHNGKLMGLIAIGDPVFNLSVRDNHIGWGIDDRAKRLVNIMDAYVLGAVPPYSDLLGGKLIACLLRSRELYFDFYHTYGSTEGIISGEQKNARLLMITTSSSMGRSSVYNRLALDGVRYFSPIGYTGGWGHFHIPDKLFEELRDYLRLIGHSYADLHRFGEGPNWRFRTTRAALSALGLNEDLLRHGIQRQVLICELASNAAKLLRSGRGRPNISALLSVSEVAELAIQRWMIPRAIRRPGFKLWARENLAALISGQPERPLQKQAAGD